MITNKTDRKNVYEEVTEKIITALEDGLVPWTRPWDAACYGVFRNAITDRPYRGLNILLLNLAAMMLGYTDPRWLTFRTAEKLGARIRKGEKGVRIVFWKFPSVLEKDDQEDTNRTSQTDREQKVIPFARQYTVFNVEQCEGLTLPSLDPVEEVVLNEDNKAAERILAVPVIRHGGGRAAYSPSADRITMPPRSAFDNLDFYYTTAFHEIIHWTGHSARLARTFGNRFGDLDYAFEELVAEIGAAFLGAHAAQPFTEMRHPEYINSWLTILKTDSKAIFTAAAKAQNAADFVLDKAGLAHGEEANLPEAA